MWEAADLRVVCINGRDVWGHIRSAHTPRQFAGHRLLAEHTQIFFLTTRSRCSSESRHSKCQLAVDNLLQRVFCLQCCLHPTLCGLTGCVWIAAVGKVSIGQRTKMKISARAVLCLSLCILSSPVADCQVRVKVNTRLSPDTHVTHFLTDLVICRQVCCMDWSRTLTSIFKQDACKNSNSPQLNYLIVISVYYFKDS